MAESRLQRWSRKKTETRREPEPPTPPVREPELSPEEQDLAINEALPEHEVLEKYSLPDPDNIELGTDITGFMRKEIPELLRRRALRSLWKSNPVLAVLDGLNDYDEDFTDAASAGNIVKTLYKVGQGFDRTPKVEEKAEEHIEQTADEKAEEQVERQRREQVETPKVSTPAEESWSVAEAAEEPAPHYRPRMRFE